MSVTNCISKQTYLFWPYEIVGRKNSFKMVYANSPGEPGPVFVICTGYIEVPDSMCPSLKNVKIKMYTV